MTRFAPSRTWVRVVNGLMALALAVLVQATYWPLVKTFDLYRADLGYGGAWIGDHAKQITTISPDGPADRAGLTPGDVLEFDPMRPDDWVLASYRHMPEGFTGTLPVRHANGTRSIVTLVPERIAFLPTFNDRAALVIRMVSGATFLLMAVFLVWARPGVMTWCFLIFGTSGNPSVLYANYYLAFEATGHLQAQAFVPPFSLAVVVWLLPFAVAFPRATSPGWPWWKWAVGISLFLLWLAYLCREMYVAPFERELFPSGAMIFWATGTVSCLLTAIGAFVGRYRHSDGVARARLRWGLLGMSFAFVLYVLWAVQFVTRFAVSGSLSASALTPGQWLFAVTNLVVFPLSFGYSILRERVLDVQFAISRTVVYGIVSTLVLLFLTVVHWLLGRMIEHSRLALGLEGLAAIGLGLVLHRASHTINSLVDRVLFRKHHAAEERLRQVTAALPFANTAQSIADAVVVEPARNLDLASAALFDRESADGPLQRVRAVGWGDGHASSLDAESLLVRYLQAEHAALRLDGDRQWLPDGMPDGAAHPVLAIPVVTQHAVTAVVLYGSHANSTLPDPDEVQLLEALARAAATSHQQVRIAQLAREVDVQRIRNEQLEQSLRVLAGGRP